MIIETKGIWRCTNCSKEIATSCELAASDMESFSWENSTMIHWCRQGDKKTACTLVGQINDIELVERLSPAALERLRVRLNAATPTPTPPVKRGPGKPPKVKAEA